MQARKMSVAVVAVLVGLGWAAPAVASVIMMQSSLEFSGETIPVGSPPWLTATFQDIPSGSVQFTLFTTNLTANEFVSNYFFNLDPALAPGQLVFSAPTKVGSFDSPSISTGVDSFKADGDGYFDVNLGFRVSDGLSTRFTAGDSVSYTISGIPGLSAWSFAFTSTHDGSPGIFSDAAHVQGIGSGGLSGWVASSEIVEIVPEPTVLGLLALGGLALIRRRR